MEKIAIIFPGFVMFMLLVIFGAVEVGAQTENLPDDEGGGEISKLIGALSFFAQAISFTKHWLIMSSPTQSHAGFMPPPNRRNFSP
ncbi:hypothetical protein TIFTF001_012664 [Ficus carica]|uniref:Uncharacterized protein n=1 Tax=Ficus carica TaxID=3494 RepID=A0AA88ANN3_FICCA|nr:hypothetical protein TIFTF001_012664 [Ficus carica]